MNAVEFADWFEGSEVVDSKGMPRPLFHGTVAVFDKFNEGAIFLTSTKEHADNYGPVHMRVYAAIKRPVLLEEDALRALAWRKSDVTKFMASGYDGAKQIGKNVWVAFSSQQVILASQVAVKKPKAARLSM